MLFTWTIYLLLHDMERKEKRKRMSYWRKRSLHGLKHTHAHTHTHMELFKMHAKLILSCKDQKHGGHGWKMLFELHNGWELMDVSFVIATCHSLSSCPFGDVTGLLMDVNYKSWMKHLCMGKRNARSWWKCPLLGWLTNDVWIE